jgi:hypothetical protein
MDISSITRSTQRPQILHAKCLQLRQIGMIRRESLNPISIQKDHYHEPLSRLHIVHSDPGFSPFLIPAVALPLQVCNQGGFGCQKISPLAIVVFLLCFGAILLSRKLLLGQEHTTRID